MASVVTTAMTTAMMEKSSSSSPKSPPRGAKSSSAADHRAAERESLLVRLLDSVKQCQIRFGKKTTTTINSTATTALATEAEAQVICLLTNLEAALSHGLKLYPSSGGASSGRPLGGLFSSSSSEFGASSSGGRPTFWAFVRTFLGPDELIRFDTSGCGVSTDVGRSRAWLRTAINENTLERYFYSLVNEGERIKAYYESWSFMRDEEKSSVLPSMAAGLKTILFNVSTDGAELDHVPKTSSSSSSGAQTILNSIPLGGMIRDTILSSSLSSSVPNGRSTGFPDGFSTSAYGDEIKDYLEPVIVEESPKRLANESSESAKSVSSSSSSYSANSDRTSHSGLVTSSRKSVGKKKKKTVANIVNLDEDDNDAVGPPHQRLPHQLQSASFVPSLSTTTSQRHRLSDPPSALELPSEPSGGATTTTKTNATSQRESDIVIEEKQCKSSSDSRGEMRFVGGGNSGDILSPVTPVTLNSAASDFTLADATTNTPSIAVSKDAQHGVDNHDCDSSDAVSVKSLGQVSIASSSTSELSTSATFPHGNVPPSFSAPSPFSSTTIAPSSISSQNKKNTRTPTLLSLRDGRSVAEAEAEAGTFVVGMTTAVSSSTSDDADLESLSASELRGAIVSIMQSKDEIGAALEETRRRLAESRHQIEILREENAAGRDLAEKLEKKVAETETNGDNKRKFLQRENQLLKHQLKKYVGTVQSLQRQKSSVDDVDGGGTASDGGVHAAIVKLSLEEAQGEGRGGDYSANGVDDDDEDADEIRKSYEQKLIQVSEMHSELMEFNDQLVMQLKQKDRILDGLRTELEELRGPLPSNYAAENDDTMSLASEADDMVSCTSSVLPNSSSSCSFRALVNIWIPSAFLQTTNKDTFHVYQVYIRIRDEEWNVYRRYAQFYELHKSKKKVLSDVATIPFPPKKALGNKDEQFVEERRIKLQQYLRQLLNFLTQCTGYELAHAHPITKERLLHALPFFSDRTLTSDSGSQSGRFHASTSRRRLTTAEEPTTPQYMGL